MCSGKYMNVVFVGSHCLDDKIISLSYFHEDIFQKGDSVPKEYFMTVLNPPNYVISHFVFAVGTFFQLHCLILQPKKAYAHPEAPSLRSKLREFPAYSMD